ncbi:hypothetical protein HGRIS_009324 [Hohenbuehelia grisea]|uniref:SCP domain-containing protein n=1 Tax=Hohenbuehelia grisea TaxID=104357 RepID=A0ABR3J0S1_9AGAR
MVFTIHHLLATIVCIFSAVGALAASSPAMSVEISKRLTIQPRAPQAATWLNEHNRVRAAHGAQPLTWSPSLAMRAAAWAHRCKFVPTDGVLSSTLYGENIAAGTGRFPISSAVNMFTQDAGQYNPTHPSYTHWTQVVWKSTTQLGCATARCNGIFDPALGEATLHVCLYNPPGNVVGDALHNVEV